MAEFFSSKKKKRDKYASRRIDIYISTEFLEIYRGALLFCQQYGWSLSRLIWTAVWEFFRSGAYKKYLQQREVPQQPQLPDKLVPPSDVLRKE